MARSKIDDFKDVHPFTRAEWRDWLSENHDRSPGVWFVFFKKHTGKPRVTYDEAVEEALCFGWIDSLPRKLDDERSKLLFTPRKVKSVWSKINKERVERLIASKKMTDAGSRKIEQAKFDGSWDVLNESDNLTIPAELSAAFDENPKAEENFLAFSISVRRAILEWLNSAKRPETRRKRIDEIVGKAIDGRRAIFDK